MSAYVAAPDSIERIMDSSHIQLHSSYLHGQTSGAAIVRLGFISLLRLCFSSPLLPKHEIPFEILIYRI